MENGKDFSSMIAAAMNNSEQLMQINKMLGKCNFELNRKENLECNIARVFEKEIWKNVSEIAGFEQNSNYEVSTFGRIKRLDYRNTGKEKILKPTKDKDGYLQVGLTTNGKRKYFYLHRIVASAFVKNDDPENKTICNHINHGSKTDNHYKNLEWCTQKENIQAFYAYDSEKVAERNRKMSEAKKGRPSNNKGIPMSEEQKIKISIANKGKKHSVETRKKMSISQKAIATRKREEKAKLVS